MEYKLILYKYPGTGDTEITNFEFYTFEDAQTCAEQWSNLDSVYIARLWDGSIWRLYS